ncbi:MAG: hypothetical protein ACR2RE_11735 [Geminicoccaceae bacterium]
MPETVISKKQDLGPLHDLFLELCPPNDHGTKSISVLAAVLEVGSQYLYWLIRADRQIPLKVARKLVAVNEGRVSLDELMDRGFVARGPNKRTRRDLGPVQGLLLKACPPDDNEVVSVNKMAEIMGLAPQSVFRWCRLNAIPAKRAQLIVDVSNGAVTLEELLPHIIGR